MRTWIKVLAGAAGAIVLPSASLADCASELRIVSVRPLSFGTIAAAREGGVVVVSPNGAVATLGGVGAGPEAEPASIQICGPPGIGFRLLFEPAELDIAHGRRIHRPHIVRNLEFVARGANVYPAAPGEWRGALGPGGRADIRVGGTLTIPPRQNHDTFRAPFRIAVIESDFHD